ncbi:MAG: hypothetical protein KF703_04370 [Actinobacteria bacterium]|nr:hypothetical protein [Actinomycetota bacterium]
MATARPTPPLRPRRRAVAPLLALVLGAVGLSACLSAPAKTDQIVRIASTTVDGWQFDQYRNPAYPCSISGYQTFVIGTRVGSSPTATRPLWVKMRGGGAGWFAADGSPQPTAGVKSEESFSTQLGYVDKGLTALVQAAPEGFRVLVVSMCSHDIYAGNDTPDPNNPNTTPDGAARPTTGLTATKAAIQFATATYPTDDFFLHGTSAGSVGTFGVAWALQQQGLAPAGIVADATVLNQEWQRYVFENGVQGSVGCEKATEERGVGVLGRIDPELGDPANQPDHLVAEGRLTVPILHLWNHGDQNSCGSVPIDCPLHDGTTMVLGATDCAHEPLRRAIAGLPAGSRSVNLPVCVEGGDATTSCDRHVVTTAKNGVNTDPASPADYNAAILAWVRARLADD